VSHFNPISLTLASSITHYVAKYNNLGAGKHLLTVTKSFVLIILSCITKLHEVISNLLSTSPTYLSFDEALIFAYSLAGKAISRLSLFTLALG
jgi:hypothetical protein